MRISIEREALLKPLQQVASVVEKRQTLPVLANVLLSLENGVLSLTGTDLEVEMIGRVSVSEGVDGSVTVPAKKLLDICKALPDHSVLSLEQDGDRVVVKSGRNKFTLSAIAATEFPAIDEVTDALSIQVPQSVLRRLIESTSFSMAQQDVRYYLNGMLFELSSSCVATVATDGHRLALARAEVALDLADAKQCIVPRKGVMELVRLLGDSDEPVELMFSSTHMKMISPEFTFTSKLVDGKFPDYNRVLPKGGDKVVEGSRDSLRSIFQRAAILSNEKYRGVRVSVDSDLLTVVANNPEQEEAEIQEEVNFSGGFIEIGFNVNYVLDVLGVLPGDTAHMIMTDSTSSVLIQAANDPSAQYVVMPMRL